MSSDIEMGKTAAFATALNIPLSTLGYHFSVSVPISIEDNSGVFHVIEHLIVTSAKLVELSQALHIGHFAAQTSPTSVTFSFSSACLDCFHNFAARLVVAIYSSEFTPADFNREVYRIDDQYHKHPGVVINEMQSTLSSQSRQAALAIRAICLKGTSFAFNSGGNPDELFELTFEDVVSAYQAYFAPSRSKLLTIIGTGYEGFLDGVVVKLPKVKTNRASAPIAAARFIKPALASRHLAFLSNHQAKEEPLLCKVWRPVQKLSFQRRLTLILLFRYVLSKPRTGLLLSLQQLECAQGLGGFNGFEHTFPTPLLVVTLRPGATSPSDFEGHVDAILRGICSEQVEEAHLRSVASSFLMESLDTSTVAEPSGIKLLERLRTHLDLGYSAEEFADLETQVERCVQRLISSKFTQLLFSALFNHSESTVIELKSSLVARPKNDLKLVAYHDAARAAELGSGESALNCSVVNHHALATRESVIAADSVAYSFKIRPCLGVDESLIRFLPLYSKYATNTQISNRLAIDPPHAGHLRYFDNTFFRADPSAPHQCFIYNQIFGRCFVREIPAYEHYVAHQDDRLRDINGRQLTSAWKEFVRERFNALSKYGLALASVQAARSHSLESRYKTQSTGLECFEWIQDFELFEELRDFAFPSINAMWHESHPFHFTVISPTSTTSQATANGRDSNDQSRLKKSVLSHRSENFKKESTRELWLANVSYSTALVSIPASQADPRDVLCLKAAEFLLNRSKLIEVLRGSGAYNPGVKFGFGESSFQIYSDVTSQPYADLVLIEDFCRNFLSSFSDQNLLTYIVRKLTGPRFSLPRIPEDTVSEFLDMEFGQLDVKHWPTSHNLMLDVCEFREVISRLLDVDRADFVVITDRIQPKMESEFGLRVRSIFSN
ncbi:hypothetical protein [Xanthomonas oryzae]|uniref:hypothetical protein n=1 Tax=Xanthomonas oryzae TaxID=347 RepID=UPI00103312A8|nr:hypothetical protein [Xanthomonas oryzae]QBH05529.1 hypothetical protein EYC57_22315 [Xanthomonas oryzae]